MRPDDTTITRITYAYYRRERAWAIDFYNAANLTVRDTDWVGSGKANAIAVVRTHERYYGVTAERI